MFGCNKELAFENFDICHTGNKITKEYENRKLRTESGNWEKTFDSSCFSHDSDLGVLSSGAAVVVGKQWILL